MRYVFPPYIDGEGQNMRDLKDVNDKPIGQWFIARARSTNGEGWIHYQWPRSWCLPVENCVDIVVMQSKEARLSPRELSY
jgi:hypothetical protein